MPYVRKTRTTRTSRYTRPTRAKAPARRRKPTRRAPPRKRQQSILAGKPTAGAVFRPAQPQTQRGFLPFSNSFNVRLPWVWTTGLTAPTGNVSGVVTYRLNGPYDPDFAAGGHQPQQWDQISSLYGKIFVHAAKFTLEYTNPSADGLYVGYAIRYTGDSGAYSGYSLDALSEQRNVAMKPIQNTGTQKVVFSQYVPCHQVFGLPKIIYNADRTSFGSTTAAVPTKEVFLTPIVCSSTGEQQTVHLRVAITYYATMFEPQWQQQS